MADRESSGDPQAGASIASRFESVVDNLEPLGAVY
jgi:hypothetical protein